MSNQTLQDLIQRGVRFHQEGNLEEAERAYQSILKADPVNAPTLYAMGMLAKDKGDSVAAENYLKAVLQLKPKAIDCLFSLGLWCQQEGKMVDALAYYQKIIAINPEHSQALSNMGAAYLDLEQPKPAIRCLQKVLVTEPQHLNALNNLGNALKMQHRLPEAITCYQQALQIDPNAADIWSNLGIAFFKALDLDEAMACFERSIKLDAQCCQTWLNMGLIFEEKNDLPNAMSCYQQALRIDPDFPQNYRQLAHLVYQYGEFEGARDGYLTACTLAPSQTAWKLQAETLCPIIPESTEQILTVRHRIEECLKTFENATIPLSVDQLGESSYEPSFYLSYHGLDDLTIKSKFGDLFFRNLPPLPDIPPVKKTLNRHKPKVGFLITPQHEGIFAKLFGSVPARLSPNKVDAWIICKEAGIAALQSAIPEGEQLQFLAIPANIRATVREVRHAEFDIMFYFEVGTDSLNYFLPLYGLAPIQCTTWGSPVTTGLPNMDYFLSGSPMETEHHQQYYREKLILLPTLPTYYHRPVLPASPCMREQFKLAPETHIYSCLQNTFKLHPDMDSIFDEILQRDPAGMLFLLEGHKPEWTQLIQNRLQKNISADSFSRLRFLPRMSREEFLSFQAFSDVLLDPIHFGGGNTALEGLAFGTPIVTMPSDLLRSRVTYGCYQKMGITDCITHTRADYIDLAVRLGTTPLERQTLKVKILAHCDVLYEDMSCIHALEDFFLTAIETANASNAPV